MTGTERRPTLLTSSPLSGLSIRVDAPPPPDQQTWTRCAAALTDVLARHWHRPTNEIRISLDITGPREQRDDAVLAASWTGC
jgi:hypothetical protein